MKNQGARDFWKGYRVAKNDYINYGSSYVRERWLYGSISDELVRGYQHFMMKMNFGEIKY